MAVTPLTGEGVENNLVRFGVSQNVFPDHIPGLARPILVPNLYIAVCGSGAICRLMCSNAGALILRILTRASSRVFYQVSRATSLSNL